MIKVYKNGVYQHDVSDEYEFTNQSTIILSGNPCHTHVKYPDILDTPMENLSFLTEKGYYFQSERLDLLMIESDQIGTFLQFRLERIGKEYLKVFERFMK